MIRKMREEDAPAVLEIYRQGIATRNATFSTESGEWPDWSSRKHLHSRFVYIVDGKVAGWVALSPTSSVKAYAGVAEISVYVREDQRGKGIGDRLVQAVIESSEEHGIWTLYASIFPENEASLKLHYRHAFKLVGRRERIAKLDGAWRDTLVLERRSEKF